MEKDFDAIMKTILVEYAKEHNKVSGEIMDIVNHMDEIAKIMNKLPTIVQNDLRNTVKNILLANGILLNNI